MWYVALRLRVKHIILKLIFLQVISPVPFSPINALPGESPVPNPSVMMWGAGGMNGGPVGGGMAVHPQQATAMYGAAPGVNPATANIIANQSQDYIDEKLAEFQEQIYRLQGKNI